MSGEREEKAQTFWDHLDELRRVFFRILFVVLGFMILAFIGKDTLFNFILAPQKSDFVLYRFICYLSQVFSFPSLCPGEFHIELINTQLASQFLVHMKVSFYAGILVASPYIIYQLFRFVSPALYEKEKKYSGRVIFYSALLFLLGICLNYFIIFPLSFRFLGTYQVSADIPNIINLSSYIDTLMMLSLMLGIMAELPVLSWLFAKLGFINAGFMKKYRKHAIIILLILAAVITPTADIFTLLLVFFPIYLLYELSIVIVRKSQIPPIEAAPAEDR